MHKRTNDVMSTSEAIIFGLIILFGLISSVVSAGLILIPVILVAWIYTAFINKE